MKTDGMRFDFDTLMGSRRMDCAGCGKGSTGKGTGFATCGTSRKESKPFGDLLADVAKSNISAERITRKTAGPEGTGNDASMDGFIRVLRDGLCGEGVARETDSRFPLNRTALPADVDVADDELLMIGENAALSAEFIVREAIADISEALGLNIFQSLENLSLREIGGDTRAQFAEIVFVLKKLIQGFELSGSHGMQVETPKTSLGGAALDNVTTVLRTSTFKLEVACNVLGISEEVQRQVAVKFERSVTTGIIQATDPSTITMSTQQSERLYRSIFSDGSSYGEPVEALIAKVKELLAEHGGAEIEKADETAQKAGFVRHADAGVYRKLLKIDTNEQAGLENRNADLSGKKTGLPRTGAETLALAGNLTEGEGQKESDRLMPVDLIGGGPRQSGGGTQARIAGALFRMNDETVMEQVIGKLQTILRSGLSELRVRLRPESLGEVRMRIRLEGDIVLAKIEVQNQQVKEIMERNLPMLKEALARQNISAGSFDISVGNGPGRHAGGQAQNPWNSEETAHGGPSGSGDRDEDHSSRKEQGNEQETGRRFGSNSIEYFA